MYKNFAMEDNKPTTATEISASTTDSFPEARGGVPSGLEGMFSPLAPAFRPRSEMANHIQQEPRVADMAPSTSQLEEDMLSSYRPSADLLFEDTDQNNNSFFMANSSGSGPRAESVASNMWGEGSGRSLASVRHDEAIDTFDFLAKTITSASSYVSMLTRDQLAVMRAFRPSLLYEFLKEIARLRTERRHNRANPNECAFCKNNGENEECYSSHTLKDWRGRVLCPVLRAFRCPRCGATGDRAHTIKYCPDRVDHGLERSNSFGRRRMEPSSFLFQQTQTQTPSSAPTTPSFTHSNIWNPFNN